MHDEPYEKWPGRQAVIDRAHERWGKYASIEQIIDDIVEKKLLVPTAFHEGMRELLKGEISASYLYARALKGVLDAHGYLSGAEEYINDDELEQLELSVNATVEVGDRFREWRGEDA